MRPRTLAMFLICLAALTAMPPAEAQMVFRSHGADGEEANDIVVLRELGILAGPASEDAENLEVIVLLPDADPSIGLKQGDLLLMIDGQRVRDVVTAREIYAAAEVGQTVKVGFRRGDERFLRSFEKSEEPEGEMRMVMMSGPGAGGMGDMQPLTEFGVILGEADGSVVISMKLPMDEAAFEENDVVKSINGQAVASLAEFREVYEGLAIGDEMALVVERDGEQIDSTRAKAESTGQIRMRTSH